MMTMRAVPRYYTTEEYEKAMALHRDEGFGAERIERILGFPRGAVSHWIYEGGKPREQSKKKQIRKMYEVGVSYEERLDLLEAMLRKGTTVRDAAEKTGIRIGRINLVLGWLLAKEDIPIAGEVLKCRESGMSLDQIENQLSISRGVIIKALVLDSLKKDAYFDRGKLSLELPADPMTVKKMANGIIAARPDMFPLVSCFRCGRNLRQNEMKIKFELKMCEDCMAEVEALLNEISDLNQAWFEDGYTVGRGKSKRIDTFKNYDMNRNEEKWRILIERLALEKEKPVGLDGEIESRRRVAEKPKVKKRVNPYLSMPEEVVVEGLMKEEAM